MPPLTHPPSPAAPSSPPPLPAPAPRRFVLGPLALVVLCLCASLHLFLSVPALRQLDWAHASQNLGVFALGWLVSIGLARLAWGLSSGRVSGGAVFGCLLVLFAAGRVNESFSRTMAVARQGERIQEFHRRQLREQDRALASGKELPAASGQLGQASALMRESAADLEGDDRRMVEIMARSMDALQTKVQRFEAALSALEADGGAACAGLESVEAIARRRALAKICAEANAALTQATGSWLAQVCAQVRGAVGPREAARFQRQAAESFDTERLLKVRECQRRMMEATDAILAVYEQEFPRWRRDGQGSVIFERAEAVPFVQRWVAQLKGASEECAAIQRELIDRSKARVAQP